MIRVYGVAPSPYVRKVLSCLELKGLSYEKIDVMPMATPDDFTAVSPLRKVPALQDGELTLCDSSVICEYLDDAYPDIATRPTDISQRAQARWLEEYADTRLTEVVTVFFFERFLKAFFQKQEANEERLQMIAETQQPEVFDYLQQQIPEQGFLFGDTLMTADIAIVSPFINAGYTGFELDSDRWPKLADYLLRVKAHPVLQQRLAEEAEVIRQVSG